MQVKKPRWLAAKGSGTKSANVGKVRRKMSAKPIQLRDLTDFERGFRDRTQLILQ